MRLILDISRTVARARLPAPTGIDRVERAWADRLVGAEGEAWGGGALFLARVGRTQHLLGPEPVRALLRWLDGAGPAPARDLRALRPGRDQRLARAQALVRRAALDRAPAADAAAIAAMLRRALHGGATPEERPAAYLNLGHDNLSPAVMQGAERAGLARLALIHDVIPLEHPDLSRPGAPERFRAGLEAALGADAVACNSADTRARLARLAGARLRRAVVAPLGIDAPPAPNPPLAAPAPETAGGFLALGTIEPRKNHALLLAVWERLWRALGPAAPVLHIVGRRGWLNEAVFRTLDTAPFMGRAVIEHGAVDDARAAALLAGARALVFPTLAEGYGLPLAEALARGVPAIASDLPALREVAGDVPDWLPPGDAPAWERAVLDHAAEPSDRRAAQLARLASWRAPAWRRHFEIVDNALETILVQPARGG